MTGKLWLIMLILTCFANSLCYSQNKKLLSVKVECEGFFTETIMNVDCGSFRNQFRESMKVKMFTDINDVSKFGALISCFKKQKNTKKIDVRGIITFNYFKQNLDYCLDTFGIFYKNGKTYQNKKLLNYIANRLYSDHSTHEISNPNL